MTRLPYSVSKMPIQAMHHAYRRRSPQARSLFSSSLGSPSLSWPTPSALTSTKCDSSLTLYTLVLTPKCCPVQLVRELPIVGGDVRKVGYYTGIIASLILQS